jgi:hypothetical protein
VLTGRMSTIDRGSAIPPSGCRPNEVNAAPVEQVGEWAREEGVLARELDVESRATRVVRHVRPIRSRIEAGDGRRRAPCWHEGAEGGVVTCFHLSETRVTQGLFARLVTLKIEASVEATRMRTARTAPGQEEGLGWVLVVETVSDVVQREPQVH